MGRYTAIGLLLAVVCSVTAGQAQTPGSGLHLYVDGTNGSDQATADRLGPVKTLAAAIQRLPEEIDREVTIHVAPGHYTTTGRRGRDALRLELKRSMGGCARVRIVGNASLFETPAAPGSVVLNWPAESSGFLMVVSDGHWSLENIQIGTRQPGQSRGICTVGPAVLELRDVRIHTAGRKGTGLQAHHGGRILLYGTIGLNEDLLQSGGGENSFCRVEAKYGGVVKFMQKEGARLILGNGNLSASYYGVIELGCEEARITSWNYQSNPIAVNNSGRVDLHNTTTFLCARNPRNTPVGLEHDGHVLAEGARIVIDGFGNGNAIVLQKASSFFCNDVVIGGRIVSPLLATSGSTLLVGVEGDLGETWATTGATIIVEKCAGELLGPFKVSRSGHIVLPDGRIVADTEGTSNAAPLPALSKAADAESPDPMDLPPLHRAAHGGHLDMARDLVERGADVSAKGPGGWTPLHLAALAGHRNMAEFLLSKGADVHSRDAQGRKSAELAARYGHIDLAEFLWNRQSATKNHSGEEP